MQKFLRFIPVIALAVALAGSVAYNVVQHGQLAAARAQLKAVQEDPARKAQMENAALIAQVGKLMVLPDESPTIATVTDPAKLQNQPFFAQAKEGDKVLIYSQAKKAILYDPTADKIVNVAPVNLDAGQPAPPDAAAADGAGTSTKKKKPATDTNAPAADAQPTTP